MLMFTTAFLLAKTLGMALLAKARMAYLGLYLVADMGLFVIFKLGRNDFFHWLPMNNTVGTFIVSILMRVTFKLITDFTGKLQRDDAALISSFLLTH